MRWAFFWTAAGSNYRQTIEVSESATSDSTYAAYTTNFGSLPYTLRLGDGQGPLNKLYCFQ